MKLPRKIKWLVIEWLITAIFVKFSLVLLKHQRTYDRIKKYKASLRKNDPSDKTFLNDVQWANRVAASNFKFFECYSKAITCKLLLRRRGVDSIVNIGFKKDDHQKLDGHAWLTSGTTIVTGNSNIDSFTLAFVI